MYIKEKKRKYYLTIYNFKFKYVKKKNLYEGNILYFGLKVCKKTLYTCIWYMFRKIQFIIYFHSKNL